MGFAFFGGLFSLVFVAGLIMMVYVIIRDRSRSTQSNENEENPRRHNKKVMSFGEAFTVFMVGAIGLLLVTLLCSITIVSAGECKAQVRFGKVQKEVLGNGLHVKNPLNSTVTYSVKRQLIDLQANEETGEEIATTEGVRAVAKDKTTIWLDMAFPYHLNMRYAGFLYENLGNEEAYKRDLLVHAARTAVKSGASEFEWEDIVISKKSEFIETVKSHFREIIINDLANKGLSREEAKEVFIYHPVEMRNYKLPDKLRNSINEKQAALENLKRQETLTRIAEERANRRAKDGQGIKNMFDKLPDRDPKEIAEILNAMANQRRSEALLKAVEEDQVSWGVLSGDAPAAISANK